MELRHLRYFIAVAEEQHIGRAALRLNISQPPLTRQIQQLEEDLGVQLFNRTPRGMEITEAGELFLDEAKNLLAVLERATHRVRRAGEGKLGKLDIGIFGSAILDTIPKLLLRFTDRYPDVQVALHNMGKSEQIMALQQRRIDIAFNRLLPVIDGITAVTVQQEKLLLAVNSKNPLAREQSVPFEVLADYPLILFPANNRPNFVDLVIDLCNDKNISTANLSQIVGELVTAVALVASGFGISIVPMSATTLSLPDVSYIPFDDKQNEFSVDLTCIYRATDNSPIVRAFMDELELFKQEALRVPV
ncbi:MAG: LysR family transcriptional regulator [Gammaproteobacteria bacterium]|nr:LysR family transcriptional regulator [Gammaproteobacteria bacterium]